MCTALVTYDKKNKMAAQAMELMSMIKGVKINYDFKEKSNMNGLDEAIEDIKMGRVSEPQSFEDFKKEIDKMLGYV
jgi:hypothetical protein